MLGTKFILFGSLFGALTLSLFLYSISSGSAAYSAEIDQENSLKGIKSQMALSIENEKSAGNDEIMLQSEQSQQGECRVSTSFPDEIRQWCDLITFYAIKRELEPDLIAALIWQESGGKPKAYSRSGAVGLMQIMPKDGLAASFMCINGPCFSNRPSISELEDPEFNIAYGTKMLARLQARTGNYRDALKSYGPMDVGYSYADKVLGIFQRYGER